MDVEIVEQNPDATMPLVVGANVTTNVSEEQILANMQANAKMYPMGWVKRESAHSLTAILVGGGPSLADQIPAIAAAQAAGGIIFGLNGAATFLVNHGIQVDYQVILDAKPETATLVEPQANTHLLASACDPVTFATAEYAGNNVQLWHATYGEVAPEFPDYEHDYSMVTGSYTVGNTAVTLAFCLGYRTIECYGYDSSHKMGTLLGGTEGKMDAVHQLDSHAYPQPMNDGDPLTITHIGGHQYVSSLTMRLQAFWFIRRAKELHRHGCTIRVHGTGLLPAMYNLPAMEERDKYERMWQEGAYRAFSPGEQTAKTFVKWTGCTKDDVVVDLGCGTARGAAAIRSLTAAQVVTLDFAENAPDDGFVPDFIMDIAHVDTQMGTIAYCTDVMEHIPPERVMDTLRGVLAAAPKVFLQISTVDDEMGEIIGQTLHLTVQPMSRWIEQIDSIGTHKLRQSDEGVDACILLYVKDEK